LKNKIKEINVLLKKIENIVNERDSDNSAWEFRIMCALNVYLIIDRPRFSFKPVNLENLTKEMKNLEAFINDYPILTRENSKREVDFASKLDKTGALYGMAWDLLKDDSYLKAAELFSRRLIANEVDLSIFDNAECLDLGSGIGRNCLAMAKLGAKHVTGIDYSEVNITNAKKRLSSFPEHEKIELSQGNIYEIFKGNEALFDFVCCQGVIHHLEFPEKALELIGRVLKPGGSSFIYVFGDCGNGVFWDSIDFMRRILEKIPMFFTRNFLFFMGTQDTKAYNLLDFSYVPFQHRFVRSDFEKMIKDAGMKINKRLDRGEVYDQGQRQLLYPTDREFYGDFDLRYIVGK